jgi:hypothetical protein
MDWNWFFSSVAQSAAAIVAVFSAFIITKIINNQSQFEANKRRIRTALIESENLKLLAGNRRIGWYSQNIVKREYDRLKEKRQKGEVNCSAEEYYFSGKFPIFIKRDGIIKDIQTIMQYPRIAKKNNSIQDAFKDFKPAHELSEEQLMMQEQNNIYELISDIKHHISKLNDLHAELSQNQESSPVIMWSIIASMSLFHIGVIYPLGFLPMPSNTTKIDLSFRYIPDYIFSFNGAMLFVILLIFTCINGYFLRKNAKMVYEQAEIDKLKTFTVFGDYHVYLQNMENNEIAKVEYFKKQEEEQVVDKLEKSQPLKVE